MYKRKQDIIFLFSMVVCGGGAGGVWWCRWCVVCGGAGGVYFSCGNHCPSQAVEMVNDMLEAQEEPLIETEHVMEDIRRQSGECLT